MTPESRQKLKNLLVQHESYRQFLYTDTTGHLSIAIGRNLSDRGISLSEALTMLDNDILYFSSKLSALISLYDELCDERKIVLVDMCFNLGVNGFLEFRKMLSAIERGDFNEASQEILNSKAAIQSPDRYQQLSHVMKTGEL